MQDRFWPYVLLGLVSSTTAGVLAELERPVWLIVASVFFIVILFFLVREALRDPVEAFSAQISVQSDHDNLPSGFGRTLLDQMPLAVLVLSPNGRLTYANRAAMELFPRLIRGDHFATLIRKPAFVDALNQTIADGHQQKISFTSSQLSGKYLEIRISVLKEGSEFGNGEQIIVELEDRTSQKHADRMRADFIANASHELRTPLASILGYVETLQGHAKQDPEAQENFLGIIYKQAARMQALVDDLMSLSRIERDEHMRPSGVCDLVEILHETITTLAPLQQRKNATITAELPEHLIVLAGDHGQLCQVFSNLLVNALKYGAESDTVLVHITKDPAHGDLTGIAITDHGAGIGAKHLGRLTERFYRVNATKSRDKGGTGLGLAIVKHIVQRHGGQLQIESTEGRGSTFTVWLPVKADLVDLAKLPLERSGL